MTMNEIGPLLGLLGVVISVISGGFVGLIRYIAVMREKEQERRLLELEREAQTAEAKHDVLAERLRKDELETADLRGKLALLEQSNQHLDDGLDEIRSNQVPRQEFQRQVDHILSEIRSVKDSLRVQGPGRYGATYGSTSASDPHQKSAR